MHGAGVAAGMSAGKGYVDGAAGPSHLSVLFEILMYVNIMYVNTTVV